MPRHTPPDGTERDVGRIYFSVTVSSDPSTQWRWSVYGQPHGGLDATDIMTPNDIAAGTRLTRNNIDQLLFRMVSDGEVIKPSRGHYVSAKRQDLMPPKNPKNKKGADQ